MSSARLITISDFDAAGVTAEFVGAGSAACVVRLRCAVGESWCVLARFPLRALHWPPPPASATSASAASRHGPEQLPEDELRARRDQACFEAVGAWFPHHDAPDALPGVVGVVVRGGAALRYMFDACRGALERTADGSDGKKQWAALSDVADMDDAGQAPWIVGELMGDAFQLPQLPASMAAGPILAVSVELKPKWGVMPAFGAATNATTGETVHIDALKLRHERCEMMAAFAAIKAAQKKSGTDVSAVLQPAPPPPASWASGVRIFEQNRAAVATELKTLRDSPFRKQALALRPASAQCPRRGVPIAATPTLPPGAPLTDGIVDLLAAAVSQDPSIAHLLHVQRYGAPPPLNSPLCEVLDIELLMAVTRWLGSSAEGSVLVHLLPAAGAGAAATTAADVTVEVLRDWTERFYSSVTAKDVSLTAMLALGEGLWGPSRSQELRENASVKPCCNRDRAGRYEVCFGDDADHVVGSLRLNVLDFDSKRHKPLQWYLDRDRAFLDAFRAVHSEQS